MQDLAFFAGEGVAQLKSISLLLLLVFCARLLRERLFVRPTVVQSLITGVSYGGIAIIGMLTPMVLIQGGVKVDPRVPLVFVAGILGGPWAVVVAGSMCSVMRILMGGVGAVAGIIALFVAGAIGAACAARFHQKPSDWVASRFFLIGVGLAAVSLSTSVTLPEGLRLQTIIVYAPSTIALYSLATMVVSSFEQGAIVKRQTMERLREQLKLLELSQETGSIGTWTFDRSSGALSVSEQLRKMLPLHGSDPLSLALLILPHVHADDRSAVERYLLDAQAAVIAERPMEFRLHGPTGERWVWARSVAIKQREDRHLVFGVLQDITERRLTQAQLMQAAKLASLGEVAAAIMHEIGNPLLVLLLHQRLLVNELSAAAEPMSRALNHAHKLTAAVERIQHISGGLKRFIRQEPLMDVVFLANEVAQRSVEFMRSIAGMGGTEVIYTTGDVCPVRGDPGKLEQVIVNLIANGLQATVNLPAAKIEVATKVAAGAVHIVVSDNGVGIAKDRLERIFTPFFTTKAEGTGLGLSLCRSYTEEMGGGISVDSTVGTGTRFTITLPLKSA